MEIMESILTSIKKMLGITEEYEHFDSDLIIHINSVFMILTQLGVGPPSGFSIQDKRQNLIGNLVIASIGVKCRQLKTSTFETLVVKKKAVTVPMQYFYTLSVLAKEQKDNS